MQISFLGATGTVTGSKYLLETREARVLVDCGLFQGFRGLRERNWAALPFDARSLDAVVLTHAHIDHTGYVPKLITLGFRGRIYCTGGTRDLLRVLLPDSGFLQAEAARHAAKWGYSRHNPPLPLYTREDAERSLSHLEPVPFGTDCVPAKGIVARFSRAGHILGSACLRVASDATSISFSGDVGRAHDPIMRPPEPLPAASFVVVESTYGDRVHPAEDPTEEISKIISATVERGGTVVVPAFAVGRAQHLLHILARLKHAGRLPDVPVYLDSPMATEATEIFCKHTEDHGLTAQECHEMCRLPRYTRTPDESKAIDAATTSAIVVAASGMATGGRVLHHLRRFLPDERSTVLMVGYQAAGTRGRSLLEGARELKIHGQFVTVRAHVVEVPGLSAHADRDELTAWLEASKLAPKRVFVTHGEPAAARAFSQHLTTRFGWDATVPADGASFPLGAWDQQA